MPYIIYIKSTKQVVGRVWKETAIAGEIQNLVNSELGGASGDYNVTEIAPEKQPGSIYRITSTGKAKLVSDPVVQAREADKQSAVDKLLAMGLTEAEIKALTRH